MKYTYEILVGALFFSALGLLIYFTAMMEDNIFFVKKGKFHIKVLFDDVYGLSTGDKVFVAGVKYGKVEKISLQKDGTVLVDLELNDKLNFYKDYKIIIKNESALGGKRVSISLGKDKEHIVQFPTILKGSILKDPFEAASELIAENRKNIKATIENIKAVVAKVNKGQGTVGKLINDPAIHNDAEKMINRAYKLVDEVRDAFEDAREQAPVTSFIRAAITAF